MLNRSDPEICFALDAVSRACELARLVQREMVGPALTKDDKSPVTVADFSVQALIARQLANAFPGAPLVGEERSEALRTPEGKATLDQVRAFVQRFIPQAADGQICDWIDQGGAEPTKRFWTLDPIDGTKGFLRGGQYAIALALIENGQVIVGALGCPNLSDAARSDTKGPGTTVVAARGQGSWYAPANNIHELRRLVVSDRTDPAEARVLRSFEAGHTNVDQLGHVVAALGAQADPVLMDSQAKYAVLAAGAGDLLFRLLSPKQPDYQERIWDQAAGALVVEEAGGRITDLAGNALDFSCGRTLARNRGVVASNGRLHDAALAALRAAEPHRAG